MASSSGFPPREGYRHIVPEHSASDYQHVPLSITPWPSLDEPGAPFEAKTPAVSPFESGGRGSHQPGIFAFSIALRTYLINFTQILSNQGLLSTPQGSAFSRSITSPMVPVAWTPEYSLNVLHQNLERT